MKNISCLLILFLSFSVFAQGHAVDIGRVVAEYNDNRSSAQLKAVYGAIGTKADVALVQKIMGSKDLKKATLVGKDTVYIGQTEIKFNKDRMFLNGYELNFSGKKSLAERLRYLEGVIQYKNIKTSWLHIFFPQAVAQAQDPKVFAQELAVSVDSMWRWWVWDSFSGSDANYDSFKMLVGIPDKTDLEIDCKAEPLTDNDFRSRFTFDHKHYRGNETNLFSSINPLSKVATTLDNANKPEIQQKRYPPFPHKLTYTKSNGKKVVVWITFAGTEGTLGSRVFKWDVNEVDENGRLNHYQITDKEKSEFKFGSDRDGKNVALAVANCCADSDKGAPSCLTNWKRKLDEKFETNPSGRETIRENREGVPVNK